MLKVTQSTHFTTGAAFLPNKLLKKAVKAVFQRLGAEAWGHSVADLLSALSQHYRVPEDLFRAALELDKAYIPARYPNAHPSGSPRGRYTEEEARRLISHAERIIRFCKDILVQA